MSATSVPERVTAPSARERLADESGWTLIELIVSMSLMVVVLLATLNVFDRFSDNARANNNLTAAQDVLRTQVDRLANELRNASPSTPTDPAVRRADPYDLVLESDVPGYDVPAGSSRLVRYCLAPLVDNRARVYVQVASSSLSALPGSTCPDPGWGLVYEVLKDVINTADGQSRPLFLYNATLPAPIRSIRLNVFLASSSPNDALARSIDLSSGVYVRNRSQAPPPENPGDDQTTCVASGVVRLSSSTALVDQNGDPLVVTFLEEGVRVGSAGVSAGGSGRVTLDHTLGGLPGGSRQITMVVTNVHGASSSVTRSVTCP